MTIFYNPELVRMGILTQLYYRACANNLESLEAFAHAHKDKGVKLWLPPGKNTLKSPALPRMMIPKEQRGLLTEVDAIPVPQTYLMIMYWLLKKEFFVSRSVDKERTKAVASIDSKIRAKILDLAFGGEFIHETEYSDLNNFHDKIEKFDLGRYDGLKLGIVPDKRFQAMRNNYRGVDRRKSQPEPAKIKQAPAEALFPADETPFEKAMRIRREQGLGDY